MLIKRIRSIQPDAPDCPPDWRSSLGQILVAIDKNNGPLTLRQIAPRMGVSFPRIKQIQDKAIKKMIKKTGTNNY